MELRSALIESVKEIFTSFSFPVNFYEEREKIQLLSTEQVNILIGFNNALKGNIVFGMSNTTALQVVSNMMGGMKIAELDLVAKSGLGELANMITGTTFGRIQTFGLIDITPPTLAIGSNMFLSISRTKSYQLVFQTNLTDLIVSFGLE